jgi:hypothetical protein
MPTLLPNKKLYASSERVLNKLTTTNMLGGSKPAQANI